MAEQRERLLTATALVAAREAEPSVARIAATAGVGRNTFYEYFDDAPHAVASARAFAVRRLEELLRDAESTARTPIERFRSLARAWLAFADTEPSAMLIALFWEFSALGPLTGAGAVLEAALSRSLDTLRNAGVAPPIAVADRLLAAAAAGEVFARALANATLAREESDANVEPAPAPGDYDRESFERSLVDTLVRLLR